VYIPTDAKFGGGWEPEPVSKWVQLGCYVAQVVFYPRQSTLNALSNAPWLCPVVLPRPKQAPMHHLEIRRIGQEMRDEHPRNVSGTEGPND